MSKLVMVIDDSSTIRTIIQDSLSKAGFRVVSYPDGIEALRALVERRLERIPDVLILDIGLPKMDGYTIAQYIRTKEQWDQTAIVMISQRDQVVDRLKARLAGAQTYVTKPFTAQAIIQAINSCQTPVPSSGRPLQ